MNYKWIYTIPQGLIHMFLYELSCQMNQTTIKNSGQ